MQEEFGALIDNVTWDLVPCLMLILSDIHGYFDIRHILMCLLSTIRLIWLVMVTLSVMVLIVRRLLVLLLSLLLSGLFFDCSC